MSMLSRSQPTAFKAGQINDAVVLERFQAKWKPVRVKKTRRIKNPGPRFDSIEAERALAHRRQAKALFGLADPAPHRGIAVEVKAPLMREAGIGQQRDVGERNRVADQESRGGELMFHPRQRGVATLDLVRIEVG